MRGWGEVLNFLLLIETWSMAPGLFPTLGQRFRDSTNLDQNEKLWTMIKILPSTAIFVNRRRLRSLGFVSM
jgi:hypothetical protein